MTRERMGWLLALGLVAAMFVWVARNTYWTTVQVPMPPTGEAATNQFYVLERFSQQLGARTHWNRGMSLPATTGVAFIVAWNWDLSPERERRLESWVESGGRLVVDATLINGSDAFEKWSGVARQAREQPKQAKPRLFTQPDECAPLDERGDSYMVCGMDPSHALKTERKIDWALRGRNSGLEVVRVRVGQGSVTVVNGTPFVRQQIFSGDNGRLYVAATQLRRGDVIHFFSESHQASLLQLAWQLGWPVICLICVALALAIWRSSVRFGPLTAPPDTARRSLAEQIRGTGQFTMRVGSAAVLHAATARALNEAAARYINAYEALPGAERMQALANATGYEATSLAAALNFSGSARQEHLRSALELLEAARRRILLQHMRPRHGN